MKQENILLTFFLICFSINVFSQERIHIKGTIKDTDGLTLPGASIIIKGSEEGTISDFSGNFELNVGSNDVLEARYMGFQTTFTRIDGKTVVNIVMSPETSSLDEVIITALGISKAEKKIGYSTQKVDTKNLESISTPNLGSLFSGQVSGLNVSNPPGMLQSAEFTLRGKKPLIVIDGIPVETDFYDVSPDDIGDINVLKGTTASALYGARGRNGAVMITTKNAKNEGLEVTFSQNVMTNAGFVVYPKTQQEYGNGSNGKYEFWDGKDGGISDGDMIWGPKFTSGLKIPQWNSPIRNIKTGEEIPWWGNVEGTIYDDRSKYERVPTPWETHDNLKEFLETGIMYSTNFGINYKGEKGSYRISGDFTGNKDRVPNSSMYRGGLSFKSTTNITDKLSLNTKLSYNKMFSPNNPNYGYNPGGHMYTTLIWMGADLNGKEMRDHLWVNGMEGYRQANWNYAWYNNPWFGAKYFKKELDSDLINGQIGLSYKVTDELTLQAKASSVLKKDNTQLMSPKSYFNYSASREGSYQITEESRVTVDYDFLAMYEKELTDNITLNVNVGASSFYRKFNSLFSATDGLTVPGIHNLGNSTNPIAGKNDINRKAINSIYGTVGVDLYNAFFFSFAARNDWSSTLAKENRSYFYPSASLSVVLSNLIDLPEPIDYLKLYTSWANVSSDLDPYLLNSTYNYVQYPFNGNPMLEYPSSISNPNLLPEKSNSFEIGLNTALWNNILTVDATYYRVLDSNFMINFPISEASAFKSKKVNGNEYTTNGFEISIGATPIKNENLTWKTLLNWSTQTKRITAIHENAEKFDNLKLNDRADSYYGAEWMKSADGKVILSEDKGLPTADSYASYLGHLEPSWTLGLNNNLTYKNWTLGIGIDGIWGGVVRSEVVEKMWWGGKHPNSTQYRDEEYSSGSFVYVPEGVNVVSGKLIRDIDGNVTSDTRVYKDHTTPISWQTWAQNYPYRARVTEKESKLFANVFDRTFFKLRTLSLSYDITPHLDNKTIKHLGVTLSGYNLFIWKKSKNLYSDPDYSSKTKNDIQDPSSRWIGLGVNVKF